MFSIKTKPIVGHVGYLGCTVLSLSLQQFCDNLYLKVARVSGVMYCCTISSILVHAYTQSDSFSWQHLDLGYTMQSPTSPNPIPVSVHITEDWVTVTINKLLYVQKQPWQGSTGLAVK